MKNYYHTLQVDRYASLADIKKAYRRLVLIYHPDKNFGNHVYAEKFVEIQEAYGVLSDGVKRKWYDAYFFAPPPTQYAMPKVNPYFVRQEEVMSKKDKQIFFGGIALFLILLVILYYFFAEGVVNPEKFADPERFSGWSIRDQNGIEQRLSQAQFDSMLRVYRLRPDQVQQLVDSLQAAK